jgi:hypothetical protein
MAVGGTFFDTHILATLLPLNGRISRINWWIFSSVAKGLKFRPQNIL